MENEAFIEDLYLLRWRWIQVRKLWNDQRVFGRPYQFQQFQLAYFMIRYQLDTGVISSMDPPEERLDLSIIFLWMISPFWLLVTVPFHAISILTINFDLFCAKKTEKDHNGIIVLLSMIPPCLLWHTYKHLYKLESYVIVWHSSTFPIIKYQLYPAVIVHGNWTSPINVGFDGKILQLHGALATFDYQRGIHVFSATALLISERKVATLSIPCSTPASEAVVWQRLHEWKPCRRSSGTC